ncbi:MAG: hypothetical protein RL196_473 [Actinomycetota bacterium]|jgi:D-alanyl-D-alanine carboxypeptidase
MKLFRGSSRSLLIASLVAAIGMSVAATSSAMGAATTVVNYDIDKASSLTVIVNKSRPLRPVKYGPAKFGSYNLAKPASDALSKMRRAMAKAGAGELLLSSGYRGYANQKAIYASKVALLGLSAGQRLAAKPGYSEHQTGLAADLSAAGQGCSIQICFADTRAGKWLAKNAWRYGFVLRYPNGATKVTGYQFEPWHFRYVGTPLSREMHYAKATVLETYLRLPPAPKYGLPRGTQTPLPTTTPTPTPTTPTPTPTPTPTTPSPTPTAN